jgi:uncharacterized protein
MIFPDLLPRLLAPHLARAMRVMPVVVVTGARQTGKSTLVRATTTGDAVTPPVSHRGTPHRYLYVTLETPAVLGRAKADPDAFVRQSDCLVIDEVQQYPELLGAIKTAVDNDHPRRPGRFVLTGSANLLLLRRVNESLAGRAVYLTLHPLTRREQLGLGAAGRWDDLLATPVHQWRDLVLADIAPEEEWQDVARRGGYPPAAYGLTDDADRRLWFDGYIRTYLQRDVPGISAIENIPDFDRVLRAVALRVATMLNQTALARDFGLAQSTVQRYMNVLEISYQSVRLPAYAVNRTKSLVRSPKYYWSDTGLALALSRETTPTGAHLENLVVQDLCAWRDARLSPPELFHWRTQKGAEVDVVIQDGQTLLPIEIKATTQPSTKDLASLRIFRDEYGDRVAGGLLLHTGPDTFWIADGILAAPWWRIM